MENLHNNCIDWEGGRDELQALLLGKWKFCTKYGGTGGIKPCIRVRFNDSFPNPLRNYTTDDDERIKSFGCNMMRAYQASFAYHHGTVPSINHQVSHICGRFQTPSIYNNGWSTCIEPTHMISETSDNNIARRRCHHYIRIFIPAVIEKKRNNTKQTITVADIQRLVNRQKRINIIKRLNIKQSDTYIRNLVDHDCNCNTESCFINYGKREKVKAVKKRNYGIIYV